MKISSLIVGAVALVSATFSINVSAESLRCKGDLALIGDSKASVLRKCGEPVLKDSFCKPVESSIKNQGGSGTTINVMSCEQIDQWSYNPGSGQFITTLQFERGELKSIKYGDRIP